MLKLENLSSLVKKRKRVGRGGSRGGTSGRGHKGQKARSGGSPGPILEGGQMPLVRRLPKRGFNNARFRRSFAVVNLDYLNTSFEDGQEITKEMLIEKGIIGKSELVKILGGGSLEKKLIVHADAYSQSAEKAIKDKGGKIHIIQEM